MGFDTRARVTKVDRDELRGAEHASEFLGERKERGVDIGLIGLLVLDYGRRSSYPTSAVRRSGSSSSPNLPELTMSSNVERLFVARGGTLAREESGGL